MSLARPLLIGFVSCLVAGTIVAGAYATLNAPVDDSPMLIPVGHVGDRVTYGIFDRWDDGCIGHRGTPIFSDYYSGKNAERYSGRQTFEVGSPERVLDEAGVAHDVVQVRWQGHIDGADDELSTFPPPVHYFGRGLEGLNELRDEPTPTPGFCTTTSSPRPADVDLEGEAVPVAESGVLVARGGSSRAATETPRPVIIAIGHSGDIQDARHQYVDLGTRKLLREDRLERTEEYTYSPDTSETRTIGREKRVETTFPDTWPELLGLRYQGRILRLGDVLTAESDVDSFFGWAVGPGERLAAMEDYGGRSSYERYSPDVDSIRVKEWVAERANVNGHDAYAVHIEATIRFRSPAAQEDEGWRTWKSLVKVWVTADVPHPVLIQSNRWDRSLADYQAGSEALTWGVDAHGAPAGRQAPETGLAPRPGDLDLALPYEVALDLIDHAPHLAEFRQWQTAKPSFVVAAKYTEDPDLARWNLAFARPDGDAREVQANRSGSSIAVSSAKTLKVTAFDAAQLTFPQTSWQDAETEWRRYASAAFNDRPLNRIDWGLPVWGLAEDDPCGMESYGSNWVRTYNFLGQVRLGTVENVECSTTEAGQQSRSTARIDLSDASPVELVEARAEFAIPPHADTEYEDASVITSPADLRPPTIGSAALASGGLFAVFVAAYLMPALKFTATKALFIGGYSKLQKERLLDNRVRDGLLEAIKQDPGVDATELGRRIDAGWGTLVYHLAVLERNGFVSSLVDGRHRRFFPVGLVDYSRRGQLAILKNERTKALFARIAGEPGVIQESLAAHVGLSRPAAIWHLHRLEESGLVGRVRKGRKVHYYANEGPPTPAPYNADEAREVA